MLALFPYTQKEISALKGFYATVCNLYLEFRPRVLQEPKVNRSFKTLANLVRGKKNGFFGLIFSIIYFSGLS